MEIMEIESLLKESKKIWKEKQDLSQIIVCLGKIIGDICRWQRDAIKDKDKHTDKELKKELGNLMFSTIRFCDDLDFDPKECIKLAKKAQERFIK